MLEQCRGEGDRRELLCLESSRLLAKKSGVSCGPASTVIQYDLSRQQLLLFLVVKTLLILHGAWRGSKYAEPMGDLITYMHVIEVIRD